MNGPSECCGYRWIVRIYQGVGWIIAVQFVLGLGDRIAISQSSEGQFLILRRIRFEVKASSDHDGQLVIPFLPFPGFLQQGAYFLDSSIPVGRQCRKQLLKVFRVFDASQLFRFKNLLSEVFAPLDPRVEVQTDGENLPWSPGIRSPRSAHTGRRRLEADETPVATDTSG